MNGNGQLLPHHGHHPQAGRGATLGQVFAKLNAVGTTRLRCQRRLNASQANFEDGQGFRLAR